MHKPETQDWREEWRAYWRDLSPSRKLIPLFAVLGYWAILDHLGGLRPDLLLCSFAPLMLYYGGPRLRPILGFLLPLFLTSIVYDSQRYYSDFLRGPIHVREPYEFDKRFFGIPTAQGVLTPNEWWQQHTNPILDFITGVAYLTFIPIFIGVAAYFQFWLGRANTPYGRMVKLRSPQIMWAFFWLNVVGYTTYYWYAASPPWYTALYGFGPARLDVPANLAGCARFDKLVGLPIFAGWYGKSADVHGAIPSLHVAYPFLAFYYSLRFGKPPVRIFTFGFFSLVAFSAVYLNHHYVLDVLCGVLYAVAVGFSVDMIWNHQMKKAHILCPGPDPEWQPAG
jgi:membrane-associated phospholipid phosphatase